MKYIKEHLQTLERILIDAHYGCINMLLLKVINYYELDEREIMFDLLMDTTSETIDAKIINNIYNKIGIDENILASFKEYQEECF